MKPQEKAILVIAFFLVLSFLFFENFSLFFVQGDSMKPTFTDCTILVSNKTILPENVIKGDIIVIDISDQNADYPLIAHRVVDNDSVNQLISTRGDNDTYYDFPSSVDGFFEYNKFQGKIEHYFSLPQQVCN